MVFDVGENRQMVDVTKLEKKKKKISETAKQLSAEVRGAKSRNTSISQWALAVRSGEGVLLGTRGLQQPPDFLFSPSLSACG